MDLRTLKANLGKWVYSTVEDFEADFDLMIQNSICLNGPMHEISKGGLRLLNCVRRPNGFAYRAPLMSHLD